MKIIELISIDRDAFSDLRASLRDRRFDDPREGYTRIEGIHPKCGGHCTIVSEFTEEKGLLCSVKKPHNKCDPVACLDSHSACSGMSHPLPLPFLDCMNA